MAGSRTSFVKRQKEQARQEKQRMKAQRKAQRKLDKAGAGDLGPDNSVVENEPSFVAGSEGSTAEPSSRDESF